MQNVTVPQISKIHFLLNKLGMMDDKRTIVSNASSGRTESTKLLLFEEARQLIRDLVEFSPEERVKSIIFSLAYQAGIIYGSSQADKRINVAKLNLFLNERGSIKKDLNYMSYLELIQTRAQFEAMVKNIKKTVLNKEAGNVVSELMNELDLVTA